MSTEKNCKAKAPECSMTKASGSCEATTKALAEHAWKNCGRAMRALILLRQVTMHTELTAPDTPARVQGTKWSEECEVHSKKKDWHGCSKAKLLTTICSHCGEPVKNVLDAKRKHKGAGKASDVIELMGLIEALVCEASNKKHPARLTAEAWKNLPAACQMKKRP